MVLRKSPAATRELCAFAPLRELAFPGYFLRSASLVAMVKRQPRRNQQARTRPRASSGTSGGRLR